MTKKEKQKALREARHYLRHHHYISEDFDKELVRWDKEKLLDILDLCQKAVKHAGGKIRDVNYHRQDNGSYKAIYTYIADAKIVAKLVKERLIKIDRIRSSAHPPRGEMER